MCLLTGPGVLAADQAPAPTDASQGSCDENAPQKPCDQDGSSSAPEPEAVAACQGKQLGDDCSYKTPRGILKGTCGFLGNQIGCLPGGG